MLHIRYHHLKLNRRAKQEQAALRPPQVWFTSLKESDCHCTVKDSIISYVLNIPKHETETELQITIRDAPLFCWGVGERERVGHFSRA